MIIVLRCDMPNNLNERVKSEDIPAPQDNIKPLDYREQFQVMNSSDIVKHTL